MVDRTVADLRQVFDTGESYFGDFAEEISIGDIFLESRMVPIKNKKGEVTSVLAITHDITGRKKAERILRESEEKFRRVAEESPNGIFIARGGAVLYANGRCLDLLGFRDELLDSFPVQRSLLRRSWTNGCISRDLPGVRTSPRRV